MTKRCKILIGLVVASGVLLSAASWFWYSQYCGRGLTIASGSVYRFGDIPRLGHALDPFETEGRITYEVLDRNRWDAFYFAGSAKQAAVQAALKAFGYPYRMRIDSFPEPPERIAAVLHELDPRAVKDWSSEVWLISGWIDGHPELWISIAYDPRTDKFWGRVDRYRAEE